LGREFVASIPDDAERMAMDTRAAAAGALLLLLLAPSMLHGLRPSNSSFSTVPVFWHSANESGPLSPAALSFVAHHPFAILTLEKSSMLHYPPLSNISGEQRVIQQAKWIKQRAPDKPIMFCESLFCDAKLPRVSGQASTLAPSRRSTVCL
jgi:hypothetical protein